MTQTRSICRECISCSAAAVVTTREEVRPVIVRYVTTRDAVLLGLDHHGLRDSWAPPGNESSFEVARQLPLSGSRDSRDGQAVDRMT